jgi:hypothetical protein
MSPFKKLIREVHRRSLWQVLGVYEVVGAIVQTAGLPDSVPAIALILLLVGLPIVLATSFVREGIGDPPKSSEAGGAYAASPSTGRILTWRNAIAGGVLAFGLAGVAVTAWLVLQNQRGAESVSAIEPSAAAAEGGAAATSTGQLQIATDPTGASVTATRVEGAVGDEPPALASRSLELGATPIDAAVPEGEYLITIASETSLEVTFTAAVSADRPFRREVGLVPSSPLNQGLLYVGPGVLAFDAAGAPVSAFLIDRFEVTNADFARFVNEGGYDDPRFWPDSLSLGTETVTRDEVAQRFLDRTGLPGPRHWSGSIYPEGEGSHPVVEVTWYEAYAYCRWARKRLPDWREWWRAAVDDLDRSFPWGDEVAGLEVRANFSNRGATPVGSFALGVSPFGVADMAGNVEEWVDVAEPGDEAAETTGGSWNDPVYTFDPEWRERFPLWFDNPTVGFRCARDVK